jgi:hypothetical protein
VFSRLENPSYGKATLTTLKRIAAAYDVALLVEFVPFSQLVNRVSGTPYVERGFSPDTMNVPSFEKELELGTLGDSESGLWNVKIAGHLNSTPLGEIPEPIEPASDKATRSELITVVGVPAASGAMITEQPEAPTQEPTQKALNPFIGIAAVGNTAKRRAKSRKENLWRRRKTAKKPPSRDHFYGVARTMNPFMRTTSILSQVNGI